MEGVAAEWSDLFVASAGASAALAGLLFVAVSINVDRIVGGEGLPELAAMALLLLVGVLVVSLFCLIPGQEAKVLGIELLVQSIFWTAAIFWCARLSFPSDRAGYQYVSRVVLPVFGTVPYLIGSVLLVAGVGDGMYWILAGMIGAILSAIMNAWILLIEVVR